MSFLLNYLTNGYMPSTARGLERAARFYDLSSNVEQPVPRNITNEMLQTISGFEQSAPRQLALSQTYDPQYAALGLDTQRQNLYGFDDADGTHHPGTLELGLDTQRQNLYGFDDAAGAHHPGTLEMGRTSTQFQRAGDISDIATLGPAAQAAILAANPDLAYGVGQIRGRMADTPLLQELNSQALAGLQGGGQLSPQEMRALDQQSRTGFADRGNFRGNQSLGAELLSRDAAVRQRQQQAQQLAGTVQGMNQNQNDFIGRGTQIFSSALGDPAMAVLGRSSGIGGVSGGGIGSGGGPPQQIGTGARPYDPLNAYASDVYNTNYNAQASTNIANANNTSSRNNALLQAGVGLLGAFLSDRRLKKNVRSTGRKTKDGIPEKRWQYKTDKSDRTFVGVVAQDVEKVRPDAVIEDPFSGVKAVDYGKLDTPFFEERQMLAA